jgi:hypothetical protein
MVVLEFSVRAQVRTKKLFFEQSGASQQACQADWMIIVLSIFSVWFYVERQSQNSRQLSQVSFNVVLSSSCPIKVTLLEARLTALNTYAIGSTPLPLVAHCIG